MVDDLKKDTLRALSWSFLERFSQQGIQFLISIIMARLLLPEEFGLVAMLSIFIAISQAFINSGFGQSLIQKQNSTHIDECSIFYFNLLVAFLAASLLFIAAPWISDFYNQPQLVSMTRVLSLTLIFNSLGLVQRTLLNKKLDFKTQLKVSVIASTISGVIGVTMALKGYGVWSLVALTLCNDFFNTIFLWIFNSWRPALSFSFDSLKSLYVFGSRLFLVSLSNAAFANIYQLVIGKFFTASSLGFYSRANSLYKYPVVILNSVVSQVSFPVFSKIQDDKLRLKKTVSKALVMLTLVTFPLMIGLAAVANPLVLILLTEKWLPSVPFLQLLCVIGILYPIQAINLNALNAQGRSDLHLKLDILNKVLILAAVVITYRFGITAMIYGQILNSLIAYYLYAYYTGKLLGYSILSQIKDMFPSVALACLMGLVVFSITFLPITNQLLLLLVQITVGVLTYIGLCYFFRLSAFFEIINILKQKFNKH